ncbi:MAG: alcohol dehydrogenase catalytic domain-containing protein [Proteobacteria bacterium]|nr:alcohol dehydrogenase catalytic domain-containing protein [Pseudomonadota bacterium]MBU2228079.1 alcohol dehydrogenase catalytic domain-containing protein [Pseudomonadota bacterium]MBU2260970.1 alcohol dehydrogenase catalytic domain-containing protein [Pseudomonadota bacterium]
MKFFVLTEPFRFEMKELPVPELKDDEILITIKKVGICGSEITAYRGVHKYRIPPVILGHEMAGAVSAIGRDVRRFKEGDRVVVKPHTFCGKCPNCLRGEQNICREKKVLGSREWPGAFGAFIVSPEYLVHALPDAVGNEEAALLDPLCVGLHAVRQARVQAGDRVAILGAGSIGLSTLLIARTAGAETYITDVKRTNLDIAKTLGATGAFNVAQEGEGPRLDQWAADLPLDAVFITAGVESEVPRALKMVGRGGRVVVIAHFHNPDISVDMFTLLTQEKRLQGSITYTGLDLDRGIHLLAQKAVDVRPLISERRNMGEIQSCFERLSAGEEGLIKILLTP